MFPFNPRYFLAHKLDTDWCKLYLYELISYYLDWRSTDLSVELREERSKGGLWYGERGGEGERLLNLIGKKSAFECSKHIHIDGFVMHS